jgi:hypothetical protein
MKKMMAALIGLISLNVYAHSLHSLEYVEFLPVRDLMGKVSIKNKNVLNQLNQFGIDVAGVDVPNQIADIIISAEELKLLESQQIQVQIVMTKNLMAAPDSEYKNPDEIESLLKQFHARFRDISRLEVIGQSLEGRNIWAIVISDDVTVKDQTEPVILFNSMHHAREMMTPEVGLDIIEQLLTNYGADESVTRWVNNNEIWIVPMFNVDGNNLAWTKNSMWRKNARGGYGVDLNRNYPKGWGSCNGSSGSRTSDTYRGEAPASEPETKAMMNLIKKIRPVFDISYHSYSELVLYPFGCKGQKTQTEEVVAKIGQQMGQALKYQPGTPWEILYSADGGDIDWMYDEYQVIPYVIEINSTREGFQPSYSKWRDVTVERNRLGWQLLLNRLETSSIRAYVKDENGLALTGDYIINVYKVDGTNTKLFQTFKSQEFGVVHAVVNPGNYKLEVKTAQRSIQSDVINVENSRVELDLSI